MPQICMRVCEYVLFYEQNKENQIENKIFLIWIFFTLFIFANKQCKTYNGKGANVANSFEIELKNRQKLW